MKPTITLVFAMVLSLACLGVQAQDRILTRQGETIECKVQEIGTEEISYTLAEYEHSVSFSILKSRVDRILFENGKEMVIDHAEAAMASAEHNSADLFLVQNRNALKINFLSPLFGHTSFSYERALKPGQSLEAGLGIVGLAFNNPEDALGLSLQFGYKFIRSPDFYLKDMRYAHILKGGYVKPELVLANYTLRQNDSNVTKAALVLNLGKQWVYSDVFLVDFYFGLGYGYSSGNFDSAPYGIFVGDGNVPIALQLGLRIGFLM
jgi:hypothetical protein